MVVSVDGCRFFEVSANIVSLGMRIDIVLNRDESTLFSM